MRNSFSTSLRSRSPSHSRCNDCKHAHAKDARNKSNQFQSLRIDGPRLRNASSSTSIASNGHKGHIRYGGSTSNISNKNVVVVASCFIFLFPCLLLILNYHIVAKESDHLNSRYYLSAMIGDWRFQNRSIRAMNSPRSSVSISGGTNQQLDKGTNTYNGVAFQGTSDTKGTKSFQTDTSPPAYMHYYKHRKSFPSISTGHPFQPETFKQNLDRWRQITNRIHHKRDLVRRKERLPNHRQNKIQNQRLSGHNVFMQQHSSKHGLQSTRLSTPFLDQQTLFRKRNSWHLMVVIMADDCFPHKFNYKNPNTFAVLGTLRDAMETDHADLVVFLPQLPQSTLLSEASRLAKDQYETCQARLSAMIQSQHINALEDGKLQLVYGVVNPLAPRIKYDYLHLQSRALNEWKKSLDPTFLSDDEVFLQVELDNNDKKQFIIEDNVFLQKTKHLFERQQFQLEVDYSLGLDFAYLSELVYQYGDLMLILQSGTRLRSEYRSHRQENRNHSVDRTNLTAETAVRTTSTNTTEATENQNAVDYGQQIVEQYEQYKLRAQNDSLARRFCYMSFLEQDQWMQLPNATNITMRYFSPFYQSELALPTGIVFERHGLYRMSMVLRSFLPYHKRTTSELMIQYCTELLWEVQIVQPISPTVDLNGTDELEFPPALWTDVYDDDAMSEEGNADTVEHHNMVNPKLMQQIQREQQRWQRTLSHLTVPPWVTVENSQLGPQREMSDTSLASETNENGSNATQVTKKMITFLVPTSTRPNGIKNLYVTTSLNQLLPLIRPDFRQADGTLDASVLLVICGNTEDEIDDHESGLKDYYGPELEEGILEIVRTNLDTYPTLQNLPDHYGDTEHRVRWRSKQNLDLSSSFFAAKGRSEYIMLLEDDTGFQDGFTNALRNILEKDIRHEDKLIPDQSIVSQVIASPSRHGELLPSFDDDFRQHVFAQIHFGFGYSGVLLHDDDALVYAILHFVLMDEKPCDLFNLANYIQGENLDHEFRWFQELTLLSHLGSVSSLRGKFWDKQG